MPIPGGPRPAKERAKKLRDLALVVGGQASVDDAVFRGISLSTFTLQPGDLYLALPGQHQHGARFVTQAVAAGASAVLTDAAGAALLTPTSAAAAEVPVLVVPEARQAAGAASAWFYDYPARSMTMFGVTGTNGKTTTSYLMHAALAALGPAGLIGTVRIAVGAESFVPTGTTPEAPDLQALLALMVERGVRSCAMEISSHALSLHRVAGLRVNSAGFTNVSQDHLDFHPTMDEYFAAKARLFTSQYADAGVVCVDDAYGARLVAETSIPVLSVSSDPQAAGQWSASRNHWQVTQVVPVAGRGLATVHTPVGVVQIHAPLPGQFNVANAVLAVAMLTQAGCDLQQAAQAVAAAPPVPGRMTQIAGSGIDGIPLVVVDFAHTPAAVAVALAAVRSSSGTLVAVIGAGGDRDVSKRPLMGAAAAELAQVVVVTDDNPRSEDPAAIRQAVLSGIPADTRARSVQIADRAQAITYALEVAWSQADPASAVVLIAGKGHESGQEIAGVMHPFDDVQVATAAVTALRQSQGLKT